MTKVLVDIDDELWRRARVHCSRIKITNEQFITNILTTFLDAIEPVLPPERTGMVFAAAKRENKADVSTGLPPSALVSASAKSVARQVKAEYADIPVHFRPVTGSDIRKAAEPLIHKPYDAEPLDLRYAPIRPVPKPARKK